MSDWALYGGAGFIGQHLALSILQQFPDDRVCLLDIEPDKSISWRVPLELFLEGERLSIVQCDVRNYQSIQQTPFSPDTIINLAAIHREPGHRPDEYFETNIKGAENICRLAEETDCKEIIFTSSISVYGVHNSSVDEQSTPEPKTPYGQSKLKAEQIHRDWAKRTGGRLSIIRPGVVFGPGEGGNVTRLIREMLKRDRKIQISPDQPKAGIYIEELLDVIHWLRRQPLQQGDCLLVNGASSENLTFNSFGQALSQIQTLSNQVLTVSGSLLKLASTLMKPLGLILPGHSKFHPERLSKLTRANDIRPTQLLEDEYPFNWPLKRALADWLEKGI